MMTARQTLDLGTQRLAAYLGNEKSAQQEARWLLCHALRTKLPFLLAALEQMVNDEDSKAYFTFIDERTQQHKPLAYILGTAPFCGLEIKVKAPFLIPRHETEELVWNLIINLKDQEGLRILDIGTGTGAIALAFATHLPSVQIIATDVDSEALKLARTNQEALSVYNVTFMHADVFKGLDDQQFDLIISNPPYLTKREWERITPDVKDWESPLALVGGENGLEVYAQIIAQSAKHLTGRLAKTPHPQIVLEHGSTQAAAIGKLLDAAGFKERIIWVDSFKHQRATFAKL